MLAALVTAGVIPVAGAAPAAAAPVRDRVVPYPPAVAAAVHERWVARRGLRGLGTTTTVFVNFEGATLHNGQDSNSATDTTWLAFTDGECAARESVEIPPFDAGYWPAQGSRQQVIDNVVATLADLYAGYDITFVTTRPASGHYTMTVVGGACESATLCQDYGVLGISPLDCTNEQTLNVDPDDINLVCSDSVGGFGMDVRSLAYVIAHEDAHTFGLAHIDRVTDVMYSTLEANEYRTWGSGAVPVEERICAASGSQDDVDYLTRAIGWTGIVDPAAEGCRMAPTAATGAAWGCAALVLLRRFRRRRR